MTYFLVGFFILATPIYGTRAVKKIATEVAKELELIEQKIERLTDMRNKELAHATWAQNQGDRLQFQSQSLLDAKRYWKEADNSRQVAARYQKEIDALSLQRETLLGSTGKSP